MGRSRFTIINNYEHYGSILMSKARDIASAAPAPAGVTSTELGYVDGVTSAIQTQINTKSNIADEFSAGKNKINNGDFGINQRNFTSITTNNTMGFDRWLFSIGGDGTATWTPQVFTPGAAPVSGYEGANYSRIVTAGQTSAAVNTDLRQRTEDVRTLAGQTVTYSFFAKANTGTPKIALEISQNFGSGGSPSASVSTYAGQVTIGTSWARYSITFAVPSISGKTIGTEPTSFLGTNLYVSAGSNFNARTGSLGIQNNTFEIWGIQLEAASTASNFRTTAGSKEGELAVCQRYYYRTAGNSYGRLALGIAASTTVAQILVPLPVTMRTVATSVDYSTLLLYDAVNLVTITSLTLTSLAQSTNVGTVDAVVASGLTQFRPYMLAQNNSGTAYIGFSAEL
jgi:hypothetical protein